MGLVGLTKIGAGFSERMQVGQWPMNVEEHRFLGGKFVPTWPDNCRLVDLNFC